MKVVFLDIDGVVNTPYWSEREDGTTWCGYNFPEDGAVNNTQACKWVSEFCHKHQYKIVVSSTWRTDGLSVCKECLYNGGISRDIEIVARPQ